MVLAKANNFIHNVIDEAKRLDLPTKKEFKSIFITILVMVAVSSLAVTFADFIISFILRLVFGLGR